MTSLTVELLVDVFRFRPDATLLGEEEEEVVELETVEDFVAQVSTHLPDVAPPLLVVVLVTHLLDDVTRLIFHFRSDHFKLEKVLKECFRHHLFSNIANEIFLDDVINKVDGDVMNGRATEEVSDEVVDTLVHDVTHLFVQRTWKDLFENEFRCFVQVQLPERNRGSV